ncbi:MAG: hypothetical protein ABI210_12365 [Abditibacteriaceae bacterium]
MKIRWTKNSVRFRITPPELEAVECGETVSESFSLGSGWHAAIVPTTGETALHFVDGVVQICLSEKDRSTLSNPQKEGVYFQTEDEAAVRYIIEKDFPCAHPRAVDAVEPVTETFSPPSDFETRKNK